MPNNRVSRSNEETPKWVQTVASVRGELMTRFSDRLSMEEIASCAYAVAMREGQGGTGMVEEERSRLEAALSKIATIALRGLPAKTGYMFYADEVRLVLQELLRAALEDRQEAAPKPSSRIDNLLSYAYSVSGGTVYLDPDDIVFIHEYYGCEPGCCTRLAGKTMKSKVGVPSEATPSKENTPLPDHLFGSCRNSRDPELCAGCERIQNAAAPAPEVQGTPTKKSCLYCNEAFSGCSMCRTQVCATCGEPVQNGVTCHEGKVISGIRTVPVGTPQKETPPKQCTWVDRMDFTGGIQCNFQRGHKGRHSFEKTAPVPEGVQEKEPQTPTAQELAKGYCTDMIATLQANVREGKNERAPLNSEIELHNAYVSGEAAGRRSAITEMKEWAKVCRDSAEQKSLGVCATVYKAVIMKCAELLGDKP